MILSLIKDGVEDKLCLSGKADFDAYPELEKQRMVQTPKNMLLYKCGYIHGDGSHKEIPYLY